MQCESKLSRRGVVGCGLVQLRAVLASHVQITECCTFSPRFHSRVQACQADGEQG